MNLKVLLLIPVVIIICSALLYYFLYIRSKSNIMSSEFQKSEINISLRPCTTATNILKTIPIIYDPIYFAESRINTDDFSKLYNESDEEINKQWEVDKFRSNLNNEQINYLNDKPMINKYFIQTVQGSLFLIINKSKNYNNMYKINENDGYMPVDIKREYNDFINENKYILTYTFIETLLTGTGLSYILNNNKIIVSKYIITIDKETEKLESIVIELYNDTRNFNNSNIINNNGNIIGGKSKKKN